MKDFKILKFLDKFKGLFERLGIDYLTMRKILQVKFTLDGRRVPTVLMNDTSKKKKEESNSFSKSLFFYMLIGLVLIPFVIYDKNYLFQMSFLFGILMFMMMTTLISDFSSVLLDLKDKDIILSKPVDGKTLSMAKIIHIMIYMMYITFSFTGPALIVSLFRQGPLFFIIFLVEIILMDLFIIALTALLYLLILKFFDGEKLKDIINYVQILLTIVLTVGYQLIGRLFNFSDIFDVKFNPRWWQHLIFPIWFGGPFELILKNNYNLHIISFSLLALIIPILSIIIYTKLMPSFESNLQKLNDSSGNVKDKSRGYSYRMSKIVCRTKEEKTFFRFATNMMKNEREFKLRVYPSLGFSLIFPFIFLLAKLKDNGLEYAATGKIYFTIYFIAFMIPTIIMNIGYSGNHKGAWIYKTMPLKDASSIYKGTVKALMINFLLPLYILQSIVFILILKSKILIHLVVIFLSISLYAVVCFKLMKKKLPFSQAFGVANQSEGLIVIPLFLIMAVLAGIHYGSTKFIHGPYVYIIILIVANIFLWNKGFNIPMESIEE